MMGGLEFHTTTPGSHLSPPPIPSSGGNSSPTYLFVLVIAELSSEALSSIRRREAHQAEAEGTNIGHTYRC